LPDPATAQPRSNLLSTAEGLRLSAPHDAGWRCWGPYLSERQWGTVREDYSADGDAWDYFPTTTRAAAPTAGARTASPASATTSSGCASRWRCGTARPDPQGAAVRPHQQRGQPRRGREGVLLLPRLHADALVHEVCSTSTRRREFPTRPGRGEPPARRDEPEYELLDTGVFDDDRYFDVFVEYAKAGPEDILIRSPSTTAARGGPLHVLPTLWFRNTWAGGRDGPPRPSLRAAGPARDRAPPSPRPRRATAVLRRARARAAVHRERDQRRAALRAPNPTPYVKDASTTTSCTADATPSTRRGPAPRPRRTTADRPGRAVGPCCAAPRRDGDRAAAPPPSAGLRRRLRRAHRRGRRVLRDAASRRHPRPDARRVQRQASPACSGASSSTTTTSPKWLDGDPAQPPPPPERGRAATPSGSGTSTTRDVISMPDKWEYPWYAAWDLAFHCVPLALVDPDFAKEQLC
jgi:hypothetical protein